MGDPRALDAVEQGLAIARELGDPVATAELLRHFGELLLYGNKPDEAESWFVESIHAAEAPGNLWNIGWTKYNFGILAEVRGEYEAARELYLECNDIFQTHFSMADAVTTRLGELAWRLGDAAETARWFRIELDCGTSTANLVRMAHGHEGLGRAAYLAGDYPLAGRHYAAIIELELAQPHVDPAFIGYVLRGVAAVHVAPGSAVRLFGHALAYDTLPGPFRIAPLDYARPAHERALAACRESLGDTALEAAWAAGRAL